MPIEGPKALRVAIEQQTRVAKHEERKALIISGTLWVVSSIALCAIASILIAKAVMKGKDTLEKIKQFWKEPLPWHFLMMTPSFASECACLCLYDHMKKESSHREWALQRTMENFEDLKNAKNVQEILSPLWDKGALNLEILEHFQLIVLTDGERSLLLSKIEEYKKLSKAHYHAALGCIPREKRAKEAQAALDAFLEENLDLVGWVQERLREPKVSDDPFEAEGRIRSEVFVRDSEFRDFD